MLKPQIKVHCDVYAENYVDPKAFASHLHRQIGNTSTTNSSTDDGLFNNRSTSCDESWLISGRCEETSKYPKAADLSQVCS